MFSNKYIFTYAAIMVTVVAIILSSAATLLQPMQDFNKRVEKMSGILASADIYPESKQEVPESYKEYITEEWVINNNGDIISKYADGELKMGDFRAFDIDLKTQLDKVKAGNIEEAHFPIYVFTNKGDTSFIVPLRGKGLWGPIWGNIALDSDFRTVRGATFGHKSETPGLGAEISLPEFQNQFKGKTIFNENYEFTSIEVVKGGVENSNINPSHGVDAISGGTITSNGVSDMLEDVLSIYKPFVEKHII
jgi:Na+-transporting NADH:ubiquinone oxidoreductase subunit C